MKNVIITLIVLMTSGTVQALLVPREMPSSAANPEYYTDFGNHGRLCTSQTGDTFVLDTVLADSQYKSLVHINSATYGEFTLQAVPSRKNDPKTYVFFKPNEESNQVKTV